MGQYYKPLLIDTGSGTKYTAHSHNFDNGLKLMEQSWVGNNFVNVILHMLDNHPMRVAWLGDYSDDTCEEYVFSGGFVRGDEFMRHYDSVWKEGNDDKVKEIVNDGQRGFMFDLDHADCFLVNLTKGCYIDQEEYVGENITTGYTGFSPCCINPLCLLTCVGNGRGGGDYRGINEEDVGNWAFDEIYITALRPAKLDKVEFHFQE